MRAPPGLVPRCLNCAGPLVRTGLGGIAHVDFDALGNVLCVSCGHFAKPGAYASWFEAPTVPLDVRGRSRPHE